MTWESNNEFLNQFVIDDIWELHLTPGNRTHYGEYTKTSTKIRTLDPVLIPFQSKL